MPKLTSEDQYYWNDGTFVRAYEKMGAHPEEGGTWFAVWAPNADAVSVIGDFNNWDAQADDLQPTSSGIWQGFVESAGPGNHYKYHIRNGHHTFDKTDPFAYQMEAPAATGHSVAGLSAIVPPAEKHQWDDDDWMTSRKGPESMGGPVSIYEVHLGSWKHKGSSESMSYRDIAEPLADHVEKLGFTHVEFMPVQEHPYYGSWGYQVVGYFAPTFRYGDPEGFKYLIDYLHQRDIGVILDWVPAHFATDPQGLAYFDGTHLFEHSDPQMRYHPDWGTYVFDYGSPGVRSFLVSNAMYWFDEYHIDGLRFDAVASMLYRDYSRGDDWSPNMFGEREHLEAIDLLKQVNETVFGHYPSAMMIAEESTAWPGVSAPTYDGGLGFLYKWNMGWMHDTLEYFTKDPVHRQYHHDELTFPLVYAYAEHYALPLSHDEVVHGKGSLWGKMPGDPWQKAANLRLLYGHMVGHPGKKLLFMGQEFGQEQEWSHDHELRWEQADDELHGGVMEWVQDVFHLYKEHPALWNDEPGGFEWIDLSDRAQSVVSYLRKNEDSTLVFVFNFTPVPRENYRIGVPEAGLWHERLNSDASEYGGGGVGNGEGVQAEADPYHGHPYSVSLTIPPLGMLVLERPS